VPFLNPLYRKADVVEWYQRLAYMNDGEKPDYAASAQIGQSFNRFDVDVYERLAKKYGARYLFTRNKERVDLPRLTGMISARSTSSRGSTTTDGQRVGEPQRPPLHSTKAPVVYEDSSEASQSMTLATSSASPPRCMGTRLTSLSTLPGSPPLA